MLMRFCCLFCFVLLFFFFCFFFFNDVHLMTQNSKTTMQKHNKKKRTEISSFAFTQNFSVMFFLGFEEKKTVNKEQIPF